MFGFQRTGDSIWAAADQMARGFLIGATAGRTTLTGEGLQHNDGHSQLLAATNPAVVAYDPGFSYEVAHIVRDGLRRMYGGESDVLEGENVIYYLTVYNEPYVQPAEPDDLDVDGLLRGIYRYLATGRDDGPAGAAARLRCRAALGGAGAADARRAVGRGGRGVVGDLVGRAAPRRRRPPSTTTSCTPTRSRGCPTSTRCSQGEGARWSRCRTGCARCPTRSASGCPARFTTLGTDGFGLSDTRPATRRHFAVDAESITVAALATLAAEGELDRSVAVEAAAKYRIDDPQAAGPQTSDPGVA